jgi:hypothetical protein
MIGSSRAGVVKAGLLAGLLDISATGLLEIVILRRTTAVELFQSIASGLLGAAAFQGGIAVAALGAVLHFFIAMTWAVAFAVAAQHFPARWWRAPAAVGLAYGALVWLFMDFVVLGLSRADVDPPWDWGFWVQLAIHMSCVGLPIALGLRPQRRLAVAEIARSPAGLQESTKNLPELVDPRGPRSSLR